MTEKHTQRLEIRIPPSEQRELLAFAEEQGLKVADVVRVGIRSHIKHVRAADKRRRDLAALDAQLAAIRASCTDNASTSDGITE